MEQFETTPQNRKSGQEVAKTKASDKSPPKVAKTHKDYWLRKLERHCYTHAGKLIEVKEWSIRIQHLGRRKSFSLGTDNKEAAAIKARNIYLTVVANGWDAAQATFNPAMVVRKDDPTLGDFLTAVEAKSELKPKTFRNYAGYFRRIVGDIHGVNNGKSKYAYRDGSRTKWLERVDAIKLVNITPASINSWRVKYIKQADSNPVARQSAVRSANSYLRCARSLFAKKWLNELGIRLPTPLPFEGVKVERSRPPRYSSAIDIKTLFADARLEQSEKDTPAYLAFLLALGAGLRKSEIDGLEWRHIHLDPAAITVEATEFRGLKSEESAADVEIDPALAKELLSKRSKSSSKFVIDSDAPFRPGLNRQYYRAQAVFKRLYAWLKTKGVTSSKPLHTLRKEFGSAINKHFGLYAAMTALRHADISTTSSHYTDNKRSIALPMSELLSPQADENKAENNNG